MGQASGMSGGQIGMSLLRSGLGGLSQGLQNYGSNRPAQFNFSKMQQGYQPQQPALGQGATPNAKRPVSNTFDPNSYAGGQFPWSG